MYGVIYKRTNLINNKIYIGQTKNKPELRWKSENTDKYSDIGKAIQKYGVENFKNEIIDKAYSKEELNQKEKYWIEYYNSQDYDKGYNRTKGGSGGNPGHYGKIIIWESQRLYFPTKVSLIKYLLQIQNEYTELQLKSRIERALRLGKYELILKNKENIVLDLFNIKDYPKSIDSFTEFFAD